MLFGVELCSQTKRSSSRRTMVVLGCIDHETADMINSTTERCGRFFVNVWGWISAVSPGVMLHMEELLNSGVYIRILENVMPPSVTRVYPSQNFIFQQDNCSVHTSHRVATWFQDQNINVLDWPSRSPDVNPIENMWGFLVRHLQKQRQIYRNRQELLTAITDAWHALPQDYIRNLYLSMPID
jgi:hypothetical protein